MTVEDMKNAVITFVNIAEEEVISKEFEELDNNGVEILNALSELEQYRAIGTVDELKTAMKYVSLAKKHGTVGKAIDACAEYEAIGTVEELRELKEKATAKKPIYSDFDENGEIDEIARELKGE